MGCLRPRILKAAVWAGLARQPLHVTVGADCLQLEWKQPIQDKRGLSQPSTNSKCQMPIVRNRQHAAKT